MFIWKHITNNIKQIIFSIDNDNVCFLNVCCLLFPENRIRYFISNYTICHSITICISHSISISCTSYTCCTICTSCTRSFSCTIYGDLAISNSNLSKNYYDLTTKIEKWIKQMPNLSRIHGYQLIVDAKGTNFQIQIPNFAYL